MWSKTLLAVFLTTIAFVSGKTRPCDVSDLDCIKIEFAKLSGLTAITGETGSVYTDTEIQYLEFGSCNTSEYSFTTYSGLDGEITDFFNDGEVTVLSVLFANLTGTRDYTATFYELNHPPVIVKGTGEYCYENLSYTAVFQGVDSISFDDFEVYGYCSGAISEGLAHIVAAAETDQIVANALAAVDADPNALYREKIYYNGPRAFKAFIYSMIASSDGTSKAS